MKTYYIPALITLSAGAVYCLMAILNHLTLREMLLELLIVLIIFYVVGSLIRIVLDRSFPVMTDTEEAEGEETSESGEEMTVEEIDENGNVIENGQAVSAEAEGVQNSGEAEQI